MQELKIVADEDLIGAEIKASFEDGDIDVEHPLRSKMSLSEIMNVVNAAPTICDDERLTDLLAAQKQFARWVSSHEIHVLFGGLRHPTNSKSFLFSICSMDFASWHDFAADSMLFAATLKAVWLRCFQGIHYFAAGANDDENRVALWQEITKESANQEDHLDLFKEFYVTYHYNPVRSTKVLSLFNLNKCFFSAGF